MSTEEFSWDHQAKNIRANSILHWDKSLSKIRVITRIAGVRLVEREFEGHIAGGCVFEEPREAFDNLDLWQEDFHRLVGVRGLAVNVGAEEAAIRGVVEAHAIRQVAGRIFIDFHRTLDLKVVGERCHDVIRDALAKPDSRGVRLKHHVLDQTQRVLSLVQAEQGRLRANQDRGLRKLKEGSFCSSRHGRLQNYRGQRCLQEYNWPFKNCTTGCITG